MLKKVILFNLIFVFTAAAEAMLQENDLFDIGDQVYAVSDRQSFLSFTFGRVGKIIDLNEVNMLTVHFEDGDTQTYSRDDLYVSEGCLSTDVMRTSRSRVCVSNEVSIDIDLSSGDPLIAFTRYRARVLAINESQNSIVVEFLPSTAAMLSQSRPVVYSVDEIIRIF